MGVSCHDQLGAVLNRTTTTKRFKYMNKVKVHEKDTYCDLHEYRVLADSISALYRHTEVGLRFFSMWVLGSLKVP